MKNDPNQFQRRRLHFIFLVVISLTPLFAATMQAQGATQTQDSPPASQKLLKPAVPTSAPNGAGSDASNPDPAAPSVPMDTNDKVVTLPSPSDDRRTEKVLNALAARSGWFPEVKISVTDGMVMIQGRAKNMQQLEWLAKTADRFPGVIAVINQTEILSPPVTDLTPVFDEFRHIIESAKKSLPLVALAAIMFMFFFFVGKYVGRGIQRLWGRHISNPFLLATVSRLTMLPVWAVFFYLTLKTAGLSGLATTIIGGTGAASLVIGFAFKGIAENYLSGLLLAIRSPFTKGDEIQVDKYAGFVQSLNMRGTTIIDYEGNVVLIPNAIVIQSVIRNRTTNTMTRIAFTISISYGDSIAQAQDIIGAALRGIPEILTKPSPAVNVDKLSPSGIDLLVLFWFDAAKSSGDKLKATLINQIKDQLLAQGLHIPDSAREVVFTDTLKIHMLESGDAVEANDQKRAEAIRAKADAQLKKRPTESSGGTDKDASDVRAIAEDPAILQKSTHSDLLTKN